MSSDWKKDLKEDELLRMIAEFDRFGREEQPDRLNNLLDLECTGFDTEKLEVTYLFRTKNMFRNPYGEIHGGAAASVYDAAGGKGAVALTKNFTTTVTMNISYLRPMQGDEFRVVIRYDHVGRRIVNATGKIFRTDTGALCSTCSLTYYRTDIFPKELAALTEK